MEVFVVRIWPGDAQVRGKVEHVASGTSEVFDSSPALIAFLTERAADPTIALSDKAGASKDT